MKRFATSCLLLFVLWPVYSQTRPRVVVIPFEGVGVSQSEAEIATTLFETSLIQTNSFTVIEQTRIESLMNIQSQSLSGSYDIASAIEIGKLLSAEQVILGSILSLGTEFIVSAKIINVMDGRSLLASKQDFGSISDLDDAVENLALRLAGLQTIPMPTNPSSVKEHTVTDEETSSSEPEDISAYGNMNFISGGSFTMGSTETFRDEKPQHKVSVGDFLIGTHEVTQGEFIRVMGSNPSDKRKNIGSEYPVSNITWEIAIEYCNKLSELESLVPCYSLEADNVKCDFTASGYRLPTEAEWEYSARGGSQSSGSQFSGSDNVEEVSWYLDNSGDDIHQVGMKSANELGLYDMSGNLWEWCWDWYGSYSSITQIDPKGPSEGSIHVLRGGSYIEDSSTCRVVNRRSWAPRRPNNKLGFRVVRVP